jgi:hypothetical protein
MWLLLIDGLEMLLIVEHLRIYIRCVRAGLIRVATGLISNNLSLDLEIFVFYDLLKLDLDM